MNDTSVFNKMFDHERDFCIPLSPSVLFWGIITKRMPNLQFVIRIIFVITCKHKKSNALKRCYSSDPGEIRTHDPQFRRLLLYPAELPDHRVCLYVLNRT